MKHAPMNTVTKEWYFLKTAWRFALVLTGCEEGAARVFQESIEEILRHPHRGDADRTARLFFQVIRRRGLKFPARCELAGNAAKLHKLPEPGRSALTLLDLEALSAENIQRLLDLDKRAFADVVDKSRAALEEAPDVKSLPLSTEAEEQVVKSAEALSTHCGAGLDWARNPSIIAVVLGVLLVIAVLAWQYLGRMGTFPEEALKVAQTAQSGRPDQFSPVETNAGALEDWFVLKGFDNFKVPPGFEHFDVVGVRILRLENEPVAVAAAAVMDTPAFFYVFRGAPLGIHVYPEKTWRITESKGMAMAIREEDGQCFLVVFRGTKQEMELLIEKTGG